MLKRYAMLLAFLLLVPAVARAQDPLSIGGYVGAQLDNSEDWILFGGELRAPLKIADTAVDLQPRFTYRPFSGGDLIQIDANLVKNLVLARPGTLRPYVG